MHDFISLRGISKKNIKEMSDTLNATLDNWQIDNCEKLFKNGVQYISGTRQFGKTHYSAFVAVYAALAGKKVLYLCHRKDNALDVLNKCIAFIEPLRKSGLIKKVSPSNGFERVEFTSGGVIYFRVRTPQVGVGMSFDFVIWDEAQMISKNLIEQIVPVLRTKKEAMQLYVGTPPTEEDYRLYPNGPLMAARERNDKNYIEFSAAKNYDPDFKISLAAAKKAVPSWRRLPDFWNSMKEMALKMDHEAFCRQYLGIWKVPENIEVHEPFFKSLEVDAILTTKGSTASRFTASIGITPFSNTAYVSFSDGNITEVVERFNLGYGGFDEVVSWLRERIRMINIIRIPGNMRGKAIADLFYELRLKNKVKVTSTPELNNNLNRFLKNIKSDSLKIYKADDVELALSSFWLGYDTRSGGHEIKSGLPEDVALMISLVNCTREISDNDVVESINDKILKKQYSGGRAWGF